MEKKEKPDKKSSKQILLILASKIRIMDEQRKALLLRIDDLEDRVEDLEQIVANMTGDQESSGEVFDW